MLLMEFSVLLHKLFLNVEEDVKLLTSPRNNRNIVIYFVYAFALVRQCRSLWSGKRPEMSDLSDISITQWPDASGLSVSFSVV